MSQVIVVGSFNVDHVWRCVELPAVGATIAGQYSTGPGGKGFNQAVAAARAGAHTAFVCALGDDAGGALARQLAAEAPSVTTLIYRPGIVETRMQVQARESRGGAAEQLQAVFRPWKEQGQLMTPEQSAAGLVRLLATDPRRLHGGTWDVRNL